MSFFGKKVKTAQGVMKQLKVDLLTINDSKDKKDKKISEKILKNFSQSILDIKIMLYGDAENDPQPDALGVLASEAISNDMIFMLVNNLEFFEFEAQKNVAMFFTAMAHRDSTDNFVKHIMSRPEILFFFLSGYDKPDVALSLGSMFRECIRSPVLAGLALNHKNFYNFYRYVQLEKLEFALDAFTSFNDLLTKHKDIVAQFLKDHYSEFFQEFNQLLSKANYVIRRQSVKLLGELLFDKTNYTTMMRYIDETANLKIIMNLLNDEYKNIQFEAFHVFKVFVANPKKNQPIIEILQKNRDRLIAFLSDFHVERDDQQFVDEKKLLIEEISKLPAK